MPTHAVVIYNSFDGDRCVCLFNAESEAYDYVHKYWEFGYNKALTNEDKLNKDECLCEGEWAHIEWLDGEYTHIFLAEVIGPISFK